MSNKMKKKQVQNQAQQGRSMVEMLGVLAIIGVLSIGGIAGYRMAMDRYQANQIANEINLMRTDAKIKVAQGVEELLLGSPYDDEKHLKFNENYGVEVDSSVIISDGEEGREEGYSFTLFGIPAGVCKPLATLLDGMDDTAALEINGKDYETAETPCDNEENEVLVAFSTKDLGVSGGGKACDEATCEGYCSSDGACKDCPEDAPWDEDTKQCKCKTSSKHWNKEIEACAACGDNSHCTSSSKPACIEGVCSACTEDSQCDTEQNEHCSSSGSCITCGSSASAAAWNETARKCDTCKNVYPENPNWNGSECVATCPADKQISYNNQCVECRTNSDCDKKGDEQHYWCDTNTNNGTCTPCGDNWDGAKQLCKIGECESNADCEASHGQGYYCYLYYGYDCHSEFDKNKGFGAGYNKYKSECRKAESDIAKKGSDDKFVLGKPSVNGGYMDWWSAERFCEALGRSQAMRESIGCSEIKSGQTCTSETLTALKAAGFSGYACWLKDEYSSCSAYRVDLNSGNVSSNLRTIYYGYALCE